MTIGIPNYEIGPTSLSVSWPGHEETHHFPWVWLRDHSHDEQSLCARTSQKKHTPIDIVNTPSSEHVYVDKEKVLKIHWPCSGHISSYPLSFIHDACFQPEHLNYNPAEPVLWDRISMPKCQLDGMDYRHFISDRPDAFRGWMEALAEFGFGIVRNVPPTMTATEALANRIAFVSKTFFGEIVAVEAQPDGHSDSAWSNEELGPHTDGTYFESAPGLQALHCVELDCSGGESTFVDGFNIARVMREEFPDLYDILSRIPVPAQYIDGEHHFRASRPVFRHDGDRLIQVSYNCYDRAPYLPVGSVEDFYKALAPDP